MFSEKKMYLSDMEFLENIKINFFFLVYLANKDRISSSISGSNNSRRTLTHLAR